jgi:hypothetical protein
LTGAAALVVLLLGVGIWVFGTAKNDPEARGPSHPRTAVSPNNSAERPGKETAPPRATIPDTPPTANPPAVPPPDGEIKPIVPVVEPQGQTSKTAQYALETQPAQRVRAVLTYTVECKDLRAKEWEVFVARLPELPCQTRVTSALKPSAKEITELGSLARPLLSGRIAATAQTLTTLSIRVTYEAVLQRRLLRQLPPGQDPPAVADLSASERQAALAEGDEFDFRSAAFKAWLEREGFLRQMDETDLDLARRVFRGIKAKFQWKWILGASWKASDLCGAGKTDCGGLAILFVSVMRVNGVPARTLWGRWAQSADPGETLDGRPFFQYHVKAEFFARGVGWVPVDLSSAILHDTSEEGLRYFGKDAGNHLTFHLDTNMEVTTAHFGRHKIQNLQIPVWWVTGAVKLDNPKITEDWQVQRLDK